MLVGLAGYPPLADRTHAGLLLAPACLAAALLLVALAGRWPAFLPWALVVTGAEYALFLELRGDEVGAGGAPLYAAGLFVLAELAYAAVEPTAAPEAGALVLRRTTILVAAALAAAALAALLLAASSFSTSGGLVLEAVGVAAAAAVVALIALVARRGTG